MFLPTLKVKLDEINPKGYMSIYDDKYSDGTYKCNFVALQQNIIYQDVPVRSMVHGWIYLKERIYTFERHR